MRVCFDSVTDPKAEFHFFNNKNKAIYKLIKDNTVGGPSIIFNSHHEAGKALIRNNPNKPCEQIVRYDAKVLYLWAIDQPMRSGYPCYDLKKTSLKKNFQKFLADIMTGLHMNAISRYSPHSMEVKRGLENITWMDTVREQNKAFEFHGDYWHAHQSKFPDKNVLHPSIKHRDKTPMTIKEVPEYDKEKLECLKGKGYTIYE